jgi:transcriptional repressor NrdR
MRCPFCGHDDTQVKDSRPTEDNSAIRRRRSCPACGSRFTTFERVQIRDLVVVKKDGVRVPFDREKLVKSLRIALRKRPVDEDQIERIVNGIHRRLESMGENEVPSKYVGELVMDVLMDLDKVAYVRYASVYRNFREAKDFEDFLGKMVVGGISDD